MDNKHTLTVDQGNHKNRLDRYLSTVFPDHSRSFLQKLIKNDCVSINGSICKVAKTPIHVDEVIEVSFPEDHTEELIAEKIDLPVIFEDDYFMVINKPPGMVVHPAAGNKSGTVVNALLGRDANFATQDWETDVMDSSRPGIVHRLDKDTSGCLVIAKNKQMQFKLSQMFAERQVKKTYAAIIYGHPPYYSDDIVTLIGRHKVNRQKMAVVERNGKEAISHYEVLNAAIIDKTKLALLEVKIETGRTHQIRVHLAHLKCPVLGDTIYGGHQKIKVPRQMLHAWRIAFPHPVTGKKMRFKSPFPDDFQVYATKIENAEAEME